MAFVTTKRSRFDRKENIVAFLFILVPLIGFSIFTVGAMAFSAYYSFFDYEIVLNTQEFVGFQNYVDLFTRRIFSKDFTLSILNTLILLLSTPISMLLGLGLAALLKLGNIRGAKIYQALYYLPAVSSAVAMNIVWRYIFNSDYGVLNSILGVDINWLGVTETSKIRLAVIIKNSLSGIGGPMIMYLAAMLNVPKDYYEAATIDGASRWRQFWSITFPLISPMTFYLLITGVIGGLQSYTDAQIFAEGNDYTKTIVFFVWNRGINQSRYGIASAASVLLAVVIMLITVVQFRLSNKWVFEE